MRFVETFAGRDNLCFSTCTHFESCNPNHKYANDKHHYAWRSIVDGGGQANHRRSQTGMTDHSTKTENKAHDKAREAKQKPNYGVRELKFEP